MHSYLAARWFTQNGFTVTEQVDMLRGAAIWTHAPEVRRPLCAFVAELLDDTQLSALLAAVENEEKWDSLRRALDHELKRRKAEP